MPAGKIAKLNFAACGNYFSKRRAAGAGGRESAAHAATGQARERDVVILENAQDTEMGEGSGKATTEGQANARAKGRAVGKERGRMERARHQLRMTAQAGIEDGPLVLKAKY